MGCVIMLAQISISTGILVEGHAAPTLHGEAAIRGGISVSAPGLKIHSFGCTRPSRGTSKKSAPEKWRAPFFSGPRPPNFQLT